MRGSKPVHLAYAIQATNDAGKWRRPAQEKHSHMFKFICTAALSAIIGLGALAAAPSSAQAQSGGIYLEFNSGHNGPGMRHEYRDQRGQYGDHRGQYRDHRWDQRKGNRYQKPVRQARECSPRDAVQKATRMGLRNARVVGTGARTIRVAGVVRGYRDHVIFGRAPHCPVVR